MNRPIIKLPTKAEPKKLTVQVRPKNLAEHKEAFLNKNNPQGFVPDEEPEDPNTVGAIMRKLIERPFISHSEGKALNLAIRQCANHHVPKGEPGKLRLSKVYQIVARLLGHRSWQEACASRDEEGRIRNLNYGSKKVNLELFGILETKYTNKKLEVAGPWKPKTGIELAMREMGLDCEYTTTIRLLTKYAFEGTDAQKDTLWNLVVSMVWIVNQRGAISPYFMRCFIKVYNHIPNKAFLFMRAHQKGIKAKEYAYLILSLDPDTKMITGWEDQIHHIQNTQNVDELF